MIDILLATYNGEKYIHKQIDSILAQDCQEWVLYIRDDGSSDSTPMILNAYAQSHPGKIHLIEDTQGNLGFCKNFKQLMHYSKSQYTMFCDQDDIWAKDKLSTELSCMQEAEKENGNMPILVFSDLEAIDEKDDLLYRSFIRKNKFEIYPLLFPKLLYNNVVTGCTVMMNGQLRSHVLQMPDNVKCHDHWSALTCLLNNGKMVYLDKACVSYRQHTDNCIGDLSLSFYEKAKKLFTLSKYSEGKKRTIQHYVDLEQQITLLAQTYPDKHNANGCDANKCLLLEQLINIWQLPAYKRIRVLCRNGCFPHDWYKKLVMLAYYLSWGRETRKDPTP